MEATDDTLATDIYIDTDVDILSAYQDRKITKSGG